MSREGYRTLTHFKFEMVEMAEMAGMVEMATSICPFSGARYTKFKDVFSCCFWCVLLKIKKEKKAL